TRPWKTRCAPIFDLGDYETACFAAMKAVVAAVRDASGLDNALVGVNLMRAAFQPHQNGKVGGPLADAGAEGGEQEAASVLFADAMGAYILLPVPADARSKSDVQDA
ncbi:TIGR02391 family protein, partial [Streptomyces spongiae]|uniref:TIGR02391 family protein n=1 Tax=Streptomyces spongiae TaxID=565072 RepID=UPI0018847066